MATLNGVPSPTPAAPPTSPQLAMWLDSLDALPPLAPPEGYAVRHYRAGDAAAWEAIIGESFQRKYVFETLMRNDGAFRPARIWFVTRNDTLVATSAAWFRINWGVDVGYVHMVGALASEAGRGLGALVTLACLHQFRAEGRRHAVLTTDDFRLPAVKTYLKLGFSPCLVHENQRQRWRDLLPKIGMGDSVAKFAAILDGPIVAPKPDRPDMDRADFYTPLRRHNPDRPLRGGRKGGGDPDFRGDESLYHTSALGTATIEPAAVTAGAPLTTPLRWTFTAGSAGLDAGTSVKLAIRGQAPLGFALHDQPGTPGFVHVRGPADATLTGTAHGFKIEAGRLNPGQSVTLTVEPGPGMSWTRVAGRRLGKISIEPAGEPRMRLPEPLVIDIQPGPLHHLELTMPCTRQPGQPISIQVTTRDEFDNRVRYDGPAHVHVAGQKLTAYLRHGIGDCAVDPGDAPTLSATASLPGRDLPCLANVCVTAPGAQLYIGDMHCHDFLSESEGYCDEVFRWARDDRRFDFVSPAAQAHGGVDNEKWALLKYHHERFHEEGRFVTLLAYEWQHAAFGDKVIHYLSGDQPYLPTDDGRFNGAAKLYEALRATDAFIISHHVAYPCDRWVPGTDWNSVETDIERVMEIWSMHGSSEGYDAADRPLTATDPSRTAMAVLRKGLRIGFVGGSDTHSGRPGGSAKEPGRYWGGCAAVWAPSLTRRAIFNAFRRRNTYALTGARIVLRFSVNGELMGFEVAAAPRADIRIDVWAPGDIAKVELMKNTAVHRTITPDAGTRELHLTLDDVTGGPAIYHCRITQGDGHLAVCSPVWVG